jgi:hypothetical protein
MTGVDSFISGLVFLGGLLVLRLLARHPHFRPRRGAKSGVHSLVIR